MKWIKRIFISLAIIGVICVGGLYIYDEVYTRAYAIGEAEGYEAGRVAGYTSGKQDGYTEGEEAGYSSGRVDGYAEGEAAGYNAGETAGYEAGYAEGVEAALGHDYTLRDPTYAEVVAFLKKDKTDENEYIEDTYGVYVCSHFVRDVGNNAEEEGLRSAYVGLRFPELGHAIIAFDTIDRGLVYFDAITDERVNPVIGKRYYQCIEPELGYYYEEPSYDDTIMDILISW
jgi:hypothetical protein